VRCARPTRAQYIKKNVHVLEANPKKRTEGKERERQKGSRIISELEKLVLSARIIIGKYCCIFNWQRNSTYEAGLKSIITFTSLASISQLCARCRSDRKLSTQTTKLSTQTTTTTLDTHCADAMNTATRSVAARSIAGRLRYARTTNQVLRKCQVYRMQLPVSALE
jgi:hypothetical protein